MSGPLHLLQGPSRAASTAQEALQGEQAGGSHLREEEEGRSQGREGGDEEAEEWGVEEEELQVEAEPGAVPCGHGEGGGVGREGGVGLL